MTQLVDQHLDFNFVAEIQNGLFQVLSAVDAAANVEGSLTYVAGTDHHFHGFDGTADQTIPWLTDLGIQIVSVTADPGTVPAEPYVQYNETDNNFKYSDGTALQNIWTSENGKVIQQVTADPASAAANEGNVFYNGTDKVIRYDDGSGIKTLATLDQITTMFRTRSAAFDASGGVLPVVGDNTVASLTGEALRLGDVFMVTTPGTITGILGADALEAGDMLVLMDEANPTVAASWYAFQANLDIPTNNLLAWEEQTVNLTAATNATATFTVLTQLRAVDIYDNNNKKRPFIDTTIATATTATLNSLNAITGARVVGFGTV